MAYNPFNIFRRNQKALFAVLTVFVMVVFTLSSGLGGGADFFDAVLRWFGQTRSGGEVVCKIDGTKITAGELDSSGSRSLQFRRTIANRFMTLAAAETIGTLRERANQLRPRLSDQGREMVDTAQDVVDGGDRRFRDNPQLAAQIQRLQAQRADQLINQMLTAPVREEDKDAAQLYKTLFALLEHLRGSGEREHYFVNAPNKNRRDLIDFMLWEKKADQLGIRFTKDDVKKLIQAEFYNSFPSDVRVREQFRGTQGFTMDACLDALAAEFKVRAAQTAVFGRAIRYGGAPAFTTPYEAFEFYREQCSPAVYEVVAVPALAFVDKVTGEPSETEIKDFFTKFGDSEPDPRKETPGFKEPRKIRVAWFGVTGNEPYYKKLAEEQIKVGEVMAKASGALTVPLPGATGSWAAAVAAPLTLKEPAVDAAYATYTREFKDEVERKYGLSEFFRGDASRIVVRDLLPSSTMRPGVVAATLGGMVGQTICGNPIAAVSLSMGAPIGYEIRDRVKFGLPLVLGTVPGPALLPTALGGAAAARASEPKPLPIEAMRPELLKNTIEERAKALAYGESARPFAPPRANAEKGDLVRFSEELRKLSDNRLVLGLGVIRELLREKYINDFLAARGITNSGASTALRDEFTIEDDPGLAPLVQAHKESLLRVRGAHGRTNPYIPFGQSFFWTRVPDPNSPFAMRLIRGGPTTGLYLGEPFPPRDRSAVGDDTPHYVYWRTEDVAPKKEKNLITARPAIVAAWKRMKAREHAQAYANQMADKIRAYHSADPILFLSEVREQYNKLQLGIVNNPKAEQRASIFTISDVAPLVSMPPDPRDPFGQGGGLAPFRLPESENIPYPTPEMRTALLDNRDKPSKTVLVLPDAPKDTYYVAVLLRRDLKTREEFKDNVYSPLGNAREIIFAHRQETARKFYLSVVELLKKEFKYEETEEQKKKLDENAKSGGRNEF